MPSVIAMFIALVMGLVFGFLAQGWDGRGSRARRNTDGMTRRSANFVGDSGLFGWRRNRDTPPKRVSREKATGARHCLP